MEAATGWEDPPNAHGNGFRVFLFILQSTMPVGFCLANLSLPAVGLLHAYFTRGQLFND